MSKRKVDVQALIRPLRCSITITESPLNAFFAAVKISIAQH